MALLADPLFLLIQTFNGLQAGLILYLVAAGLTLMFGVMRIVNLAHGALYMVGAYCAYGLATLTGSLFAALALAIPVLAVLGFAIDRFALAYLYDRTPLQQVLLTFGLIMVLDEARALLWGNGFHAITLPASLSGSIPLGPDFSYPVYRLVVSAICLAIAAGLGWLLANTRAGQHVRAAADNREMLGALGVDPRRVFAFVMIGGTLLAGLAGAVAAPLTSVYPGMGDEILIASFVVVVLGGLGSVRGTLWAALLIGQVQTFAAVLAPGIAGIVSFALMAAVLALRPHGLTATRA